MQHPEKGFFEKEKKISFFLKEMFFAIRLKKKISLICERHFFDLNIIFLNQINFILF